MERYKINSSWIVDIERHGANEYRANVLPPGYDPAQAPRHAWWLLRAEASVNAALNQAQRVILERNPLVFIGACVSLDRSG